MIIPINELDISENTRNNIDDVLVTIVYVIMAAYMIASIILTGKRLVKLIKMKTTVVPANTSKFNDKVNDNAKFRAWVETAGDHHV